MTKTTKPSATGTDFQSLLSQLDVFLEEYLVKKAPSLPENAKEVLVKYAPHISIVVIVFSLPAILFALGLGALVTPLAFMGGVRSGFSFSLTSLFLLATMVLYIAAIPGLFARQMSAWRKMYYATLLSALHSLFNFQLGSLVIGTAISLYFLFQVRSYYKK
jgi:hypothetical protein